MKIKYRHIADTDENGRVEEKIHDTEKSLKGCIGLIHSLGSDRTQEEWDQHELKCFERDLKRGLVLSYSVIEEGAK